MNQLSSFFRFTREVRSEIGRVTWPTWADTRRLTLMVFILATLVALYLVGVDLLIGGALAYLFGLV